MGNAQRLKEWKSKRVISYEGTKICSDCKKEKHVADFYVHRGGKFGRSNYCKVCQNQRTKYHQVKTLYGLNRKEYDEMIKHGCGICGAHEGYKGRSLSVDHCHATKRNRGILCDACNFLLGKAHDDPIILRKAAEYLER
jgi:hypothetical protein